MQEFLSVFRLAVAVLALPLIATAAVSSHSYLVENQPTLVGKGPLTELLSSVKSPSLLSGTFRNHTVAIDADGVVRGRIGKALGGERSGIGNLKVFFLRDGKIAYQGYSAEDGTFQAAGLEPGAYSFVATGAQGFAAFGVRLSDNHNPETNNLIEVSPATPDFDRVSSILGEDLGLPAAIRQELSVVDNGSSPAPGSNLVAIRDGVLVGTLSTLVDSNSNEPAQVHLLRDKEVIGSQAVADDGSFRFEGIEPGVYEFVSKGPEGIAVLSFEAVEQDSVVVPGSEVVPSGNHVSPALDVTSTTVNDQGVVSEQLSYATDVGVLPADQCCGSFAGTEVGCGVAAGGCCGGMGDWGGFGGCCGGGGFGGGLGGGLASIARFAILGWILTELFDEIDFSAKPADPVSPIKP